MNDYEMSIKEFVLAILYRWKTILIIAVLFAGLLGGYGYLDTTRNMVELLDAYDKQLTAYDQNIQSKRDSIIYYIQKRIAANEYNNNSILMEVDPYNKPVTTLNLSVEVPPDTMYLDVGNQATLGLVDLKETIIQKLIGQYVILGRNAPLGELFSGITPKDYKEMYLREIVSIGKGDANTIVISATGTQTIDSERVADAMYGYLVEKTPLVAAFGGEHTLSVLGQSSDFRVDNDLSEMQNNHRKAIAGYSDTVATLLDEIEEMKREGRPEEPRMAPRVAKQAILGFVAGGFLGVAFAFVRFLSILPVQLPEQIQERFGVRYLGGVKKRIRDPFAKIAASIRGSFLLEEEDAALQLIGANLSEVIGEHKKVLLTGSITEKEHAEFAQKLSLQPTMKDVELVPAANINKSADAVRKLGETSAVVLVERLLTSKMEAVQREKDRIDVSGKEILGYVLY